MHVCISHFIAPNNFCILDYFWNIKKSLEYTIIISPIIAFKHENKARSIANQHNFKFILQTVTCRTWALSITFIYLVFSPLTFVSSLWSRSCSILMASGHTFGAPWQATITILILSRLPCIKKRSLFRFC